MPDGDSQVVPHEPVEHRLSTAGSQTLADAQSVLTRALESGATPEVMGQILSLHERMKATAAKEAFDDAMARFQSDCPVIVKKKMGAKNAYKFAPLEDIISQTRRLIQACGFTYTITSEMGREGGKDDGWVLAKVKITHRQGHSEISEFKCPIDTNRSNMMTEPQRYGAAMTFAKRYAFTNGFGILTADEDIDARDRREFSINLGPQKPGPQLPPPKSASTPPPTRPAAPTPPPVTAPAAAEPVDDAKKLRGEIWGAAKDAMDNDWNKLFPDGNALQKYLWDEGIISDTEELQKLPVSRLAQVLAAIRERFPQS